jgi:hypothetical protein
MSPGLFLYSLTPKIFKLLPLREEQDSGIEVFLNRYISSLLVEINEINGAATTFKSTLGLDSAFLSVLNAVQYMGEHLYDMPFVFWRSETLGMLNTIDILKTQYGGDGCS